MDSSRHPSPWPSFWMGSRMTSLRARVLASCPHWENPVWRGRGSVFDFPFFVSCSYPLCPTSSVCQKQLFLRECLRRPQFVVVFIGGGLTVILGVRIIVFIPKAPLSKDKNPGNPSALFKPGRRLTKVGNYNW